MSEGEDIDGYFSTDRIAGRETAIELPEDDFRSYVPSPDDPRIVGCRGMSYEEFARDRHQAPFLQDLMAYWESLYREPFTGVTSDGTVQGGLYSLPEDVVPDPAPARAAQDVLAALDAAERARYCFPVDAPQWRAWSNPEFVVHRVGLRLEDLDRGKSDAIMGLVRASLSPEGYDRVLEAMELNGYLGGLLGLRSIMNERSYWASLFGDPSRDEPWGWQLFGHHVAVHFVAVGGRHVVAPVFLGAEPALSDSPQHPPMFQAREELALELASSLTAPQRRAAIVYASVLDPTMPAGRVHPADERHVAGAFRDNRVIPYEGIRASSLSAPQRRWLCSLVEDFLLLLVEPQRDTAMREVERHLDDTWFSWYGATDGTQPFYFRIQSPVVVAELDHHAGVWLDNRLPARFHVHTTLRLPNGNDYGRALIESWRGRRDMPGC